MIPNDKVTDETREAVGVFAERKSFQAAVAELESAGFDHTDLSFLATHEAIEAAGTQKESWREVFNAFVNEARYEHPLFASGMIFLAGGPVTDTHYTHFFSDVGAGNSLYFKVSAVDDCPNESELSNGDESSCEFEGIVDISPADGANVAGIVEILLQVTGNDNYVRGQVRIRGLSLGADDYHQVTLVSADQEIPVGLFMAWYADQTQGGVHSPEVCLPGSGWEIAWSTARRSCQEASASAWRSPGRWRPGRSCCASTSPRQGSTQVSRPISPSTCGASSTKAPRLF